MNIAVWSECKRWVLELSFCLFLRARIIFLISRSPLGLSFRKLRDGTSIAGHARNAGALATHYLSRAGKEEQGRS
jgi:hypothetical protein